MSLPYYKRFPRDFFEGTIGMSFEEKSAYGLLLDVIYMRDGNLPDDPRYIAGLLGCSVRKWNAIKDKLIIAGKIELKDGIISNLRADNLIEERRSYRDKKAENRSKPNKNKAKEKRPSLSARKPESEPDKEDCSDEQSSVREPIDEVTQAFDAYQATANRLKAENGGKVVWPLVREFDPKRRKALKARLDQFGLEDWGVVLRKAAASDHCRGLNDRQWVASFDFLTSPSGFLKTLEGNYDNRTSHTTAGGKRSASPADRDPGQSSNPALRALVSLQAAQRGADHDEGLSGEDAFTIDHAPMVSAGH